MYFHLQELKFARAGTALKNLGRCIEIDFFWLKAMVTNGQSPL